MKDSINQLLLKFEQKFKKIDLSLDRITKFMDKIGNPQLNLPTTIHVAGTNGKGSTIAFLKAMIEADGKTCHVYTSPHLVNFNERIQIKGKDISDEYLLKILRQVDEASANEDLTYFELTTATAFIAFAETPADYLLLETGLGGRLDATNIVPNPKICLFTPISYDHVEYLGNTLTQIATEKAGIIKEGAICISSLQTPEVIGALKAKAANLIVADTDYKLPELALKGAHQKINAITAMEVAKTLGLNEHAIQRGLKTAKWRARMQLLIKGDMAGCWLDGAHNQGGAEVIAKHVSENQEKPWVLIMGMVQTKDVRGYLKNFIGKIKCVYTVPILGITKGRDPFELALNARSLSIPAIACTSELEAKQKIVATYGDNVNILITGSLYLAGKILEKNS